MQKLVQGIHHFQSHVFSSQRELFNTLAIDGQRPAALFITCADSRINPNLITQTDPGDIFVLRNAGNIIPRFESGGGEAATIELAIEALGIRDVVVCGHSDCGAMKALMTDGRSGCERMPALSNWLQHANRTEEIMRREYSHLDGQALLTATVEENVLVQIDQLRSHPAIDRALNRNELRVHGWVYKLETGKVFSYNPETGQFESMSETDDIRPVYPAVAATDALARELSNGKI